MLLTRSASRLASFVGNALLVRTSSSVASGMDILSVPNTRTACTFIHAIRNTRLDRVMIHCHHFEDKVRVNVDQGHSEKRLNVAGLRLLFLLLRSCQVLVLLCAYTIFVPSRSNYLSPWGASLFNARPCPRTRCSWRGCLTLESSPPIRTGILTSSRAPYPTSQLAVSWAGSSCLLAYHRAASSSFTESP